MERKSAREIWKDYIEEYSTSDICLLVPCPNKAKVLFVDTREGYGNDEMFICKECASELIAAGMGEIKFASSK